MANKDNTITEIDQTESAKTHGNRDETTVEPQTSTERESRVPENGTLVVSDTEKVTKDKTSSEHGQKDTIEEVSTPQKTDTDPKLISTDSKEESIENVRSEINVQQDVALEKIKVNVEERATAVEKEVQEKPPVSLTQEIKNVAQDPIVSTVPSAMEPLSVDTEIKTREKGDMVVVGSEGTTPSSDSTAGTNKGFYISYLVTSQRTL